MSPKITIWRGWGTVPLAVLMNKKKLDSLPAKAQEIIRKHSGASLSQKFGDVHFNIQAEKLAITKKRKGHNFVFPTAAELAEWDKTLKPVVDDWVKKHPKGKELFSALKRGAGQIPGRQVAVTRVQNV